jgi:hypothetical protein
MPAMTTINSRHRAAVCATFSFFTVCVLRCPLTGDAQAVIYMQSLPDCIPITIPIPPQRESETKAKRKRSCHLNTHTHTRQSEQATADRVSHCTAPHRTALHHHHPIHPVSPCI